MAIILGGSASTGSSLLSTILNRHSEILCIQETHLLAKAQFYQSLNKSFRYKEGQRYLSPGWHIYNRVDIDAKFIANLSGRHSYRQFIEAYFRAALLSHNKKIWAEKTPSNIYFFHKLNLVLDKPKFIITMRNPYDVIASLIHRGKSVFHAVCQVVTSMAVSLIQYKSVHSNVIKYESLVKNPALEIASLLNKLHIPKENLLSHKESPFVKMVGWNYHEDGAIGSKSINRFDHLDDSIKSQVAFLLDTVVVNKKHLAQFDLPNIPCGFKDILLTFGYPCKELDKLIYNKNKGYLRDRINRLFKSFPTAYHYPIAFHEL